MNELSDEPTLNEQIGTMSGDNPLNGGGSLGEVTFDSSGPGSLALSAQQADPMADLHIKQNTTTTQTTSGGGPAPANDGQSGPGTPGGASSSTTFAPTGGASPHGLVAYAKKFLGVPYEWGGTSPTGFDCSGFVQYVYRHMGVNLPRISADQARAGKRIGFADLRPGDLVAVDNSSRNNGADHIGIYIGNGLVINAPHPGASVQIDHLSAFGGGWGVRINFPGHHAISNTVNKPHSY